MHMRKQINTLRKRLVPILTSLGLMFGTTAAITVASVAIAPTAQADTGGYPWANAPCEFSSAGGASCEDPDQTDYPGDAYDWYEHNGSAFSGSLCWYGTNSECFDPWGYEYRNCTSFVAWKLTSQGISNSAVENLGNGGDWYENAPANERSSTPAAGDAAVQTPTGSNQYGHVAYVDSVSGNEITVEEYNYGEDGAWDERTGTPANLGFSEFVDFGLDPGGSSVPPITPTDNDLHLSALGTNGEVYELDQTSPGTWSPNWTTIGGEVLSTSITTTPDDLLHIAAVGTNDDIYITDQQPNGQWSGWSEVSAQVTQVALAATSDGKLHLSALGTNGEVYELDQTSPGTWSPNWTTIGGDVTSVSMTVTPQDEKLHIASVGTDGNIYVVDQSASTGLWGSWNKVSAEATQVAIASTPEGKLHIAALGTNGSVYELDQVSTGGAWSANWTTITADVASVSMISTGDGKLHIASKGTDGNIYTVDQSASTGAWGSWNEVSAQVEQMAIGAT
jgi:surface antigen